MKIPPKAWPYILLAIMAILTLWLVNRKQARQADTKKEQKQPERRRPNTADPADDPATEGLVRHPERLQYSKHARCRMDCRHIEEAEIKAVLENGTLNMQKSDMRARPNPRYAVEGHTPDGQEVRIIVAQGGRTSTIVTVIDLGKHWRCNCPGD